MKGSAFKLNNVATKSALKHKASTPDKQYPASSTEGGKKGKLWEHDGVRYDQEGLKEHRVNTEKKEERAKVSEASGPPMKSPLEHKATPGEKSYNLRTFKTPTGEQNYGSAESHNKTYGTDRHHDAKPKERAKVSEASGTKKKKKFIDAKLEASGPKPPPSSAALMKSPLEQSWWNTIKKGAGDLYDEAGQVAAGTGAFAKELFKDQGGGYGKTKTPWYDAKNAYSAQELEDAVAKGDYSNVDDDDMWRARSGLGGLEGELKFEELKKTKEQANMSPAEIIADNRRIAAEKLKKEEDDDW